MKLMRAPYRDNENRVQFEGYAWFLIALIPWLIGVYEIVRWL